MIDSVAYNFEKIETCELKEMKISIHPIFKREILKIAVFKKGVSIYASKSKAKTILNMIEINHGSHLPLKAFSATQPLLEFSKTPIYLFSTKHSPEGTIICLANPLYFPNKSIHFEKLSPRLDAFFSFIKKKFHLFHPLLPPNFHTNFRKNFSIRFLLIFQYTSHLSQFDSLFLSQQLLLGLIMVLFSSLSALNLYLFILFPRILSVPYNL